MSGAPRWLVERLCRASRDAYRNPYATIDWPETLEPEAWCMTPELLSLHGTEAYAALCGETRKRLAFFECVNFFSLNIHGERVLVQGLARHLYEKGGASPAYLHHFLDEENKHMIYFGEFCRRYAGKIYEDRKLAFAREHAPGEESFLFFAKVLVFEEIVDGYNVRMARDPELAPIVRWINELHHRDEARHLAFGRLAVQELYEKWSPQWPEDTRRDVLRHLESYVVACWREYYNPEVYRDAGLADPVALREAAFAHPESRERRRAMSARCLRSLREAGVPVEEPAL
jgi:P-aminobenzoate N-oxygenase AurF